MSCFLLDHGVVVIRAHYIFCVRVELLCFHFLLLFLLAHWCLCVCVCVSYVSALYVCCDMGQVARDKSMMMTMVG